MHNMQDDLSRIEAFLRTAVPGTDVVSEAMRYSLQAGGKRIRPCLTLEFCRVCGGDVEAALPFAAAVEMIHTYSLIHDYLPCMDDDDLRRGKPACHVQFGYANALLAGDGLLTLAFETLARAPLPGERIAEACAVLAAAAGHLGMIGGQTMDLENENADVPLETLRQTDTLKTGALIRAACVLGCIAAGADETQKTAAAQYAHALGMAFQIVDDILDVTSDDATLGKPVGSDAAQHKNTYVTLCGLDGARDEAARYTDEAAQAADRFGEAGRGLRDLALSLAQRNK
ncbi:MAG: polyprenyl synthetase family protein [Clostridia bacterium]|nr:polyprenyl synthetase family protein [Clostridia bacterium]